jgi:hypothetical protein
MLKRSFHFTTHAVPHHIKRMTGSDASPSPAAGRRRRGQRAGIWMVRCRLNCEQNKVTLARMALT